MHLILLLGPRGVDLAGHSKNPLSGGRGGLCMTNRGIILLVRSANLPHFRMISCYSRVCSSVLTMNVKVLPLVVSKYLSFILNYKKICRKSSER
jgi:hypothetical protein